MYVRGGEAPIGAEVSTIRVIILKSVASLRDMQHDHASSMVHGRVINS